MVLQSADLGENALQPDTADRVVRYCQMAMEEVQTRVTDVTSGTIGTIANQLTGAIKELFEAANQTGVEKLAEQIEMALPRVAHVRGQVRGRLRHEICARMLARDYAAGEYTGAFPDNP